MLCRAFRKSATHCNLVTEEKEGQSRNRLQERLRGPSRENPYVNKRKRRNVARDRRSRRVVARRREEEKEDERMKTKGRPVHSSEAFPSFRKLPALLLSHPSAEIRAQKSRAPLAPAVSFSSVPFESLRELASLPPARPLLPLPSTKDISEFRDTVSRAPMPLSRHGARLRSVSFSVSSFYVLVNLINASLYGWTRKMSPIRQK